MSRPWRAALVSFHHTLGEVDANLEGHRRWVERAMERCPRFIGFPEFSLTGWLEGPSDGLVLGAPVLREVAGWARRHQVFIGVGFVEKRGRARHNATAVYGPRGLAGLMRKVNLISREGRVYTPGREFPVFDCGGARMAVATCADATRYEMIHLPSLRGAEVIFAPHANTLANHGGNPAGWMRWRLERWPLFAKDARVAILGVNNAGLPSRRRGAGVPTKFCGGAMVVDWEGRVAARFVPSVGREGLLVADVDLRALREVRRTNFLASEFRPAIVYHRRDGWAHGRLD